MKRLKFKSFGLQLLFSDIMNEIEFNRMVPMLQVATAIRLEEKRALIERRRYQPLTIDEVNKTLKRLGSQVYENELDYSKNEYLIETKKNNKPAYETTYSSKGFLDTMLQLLGWLKINEELTI